MSWLGIVLVPSRSDNDIPSKVGSQKFIGNSYSEFSTIETKRTVFRLNSLANSVKDVNEFETDVLRSPPGRLEGQGMDPASCREGAPQGDERA